MVDHFLLCHESLEIGCIDRVGFDSNKLWHLVGVLFFDKRDESFFFVVRGFDEQKFLFFAIELTFPYVKAFHIVYSIDAFGESLFQYRGDQAL